MIEAKVAVLVDQKKLKFETDIIDENISSGEVICETVSSAISPGTETAAYTGMEPLRPGTGYPRLLGYCNVARVLKTVAGKSSYVVGDRVLTTQSHRTHFKISEFDILATVPEGVTSNDACCAYLYQLGYDAVVKSGVRYGSKVIVFGLGALGITTVTMAVKAGASVYGVSDQQIPSEKALEIGAKIVVERQHIATLIEHLGDGLADVLITTVGSWEDWLSTLRLTGQNGFIAVLGFPGRGQEAPQINPLSSEYFYVKQLRIQAVGLSPEFMDTRKYLRFNERTNIEHIISEIEQNNIDPGQIISGTFGWKELDKAYQTLISRDNSSTTYVIEWIS